MKQILAAVEDRYEFDNDERPFLCILSFQMHKRNTIIDS